MVRPSRTRVRLAVGLALASALIVSSLTPPARAYAPYPPSDLHVTEAASQALSLAWDAIPEAQGYRVRFSSSPDMFGSQTLQVVDPAIEWTRTIANPTVPAARLTPDTTYYFQVKGILLDKSDVSGYSEVIAATTAASTAPPELTPIGLKATPAGATALHVSWSSRGPGVQYRLRYSTDPSADLSTWPHADFTAAGGQLGGLRPATTYYLRVQTRTAADTAISEYSQPLAATTPARTPSPAIKVISYNILKAGETPSWPGRRAAVRANILAQTPDLLALQEDTPIWVKNQAGKKVRQYTDLIKLLGSKYAYATTDYSSGTQLAYHKSRFTRVAAGVKTLFKLGSKRRYAVWAILKDRQSGKRVFAVSTHLEPGSKTSAKHNQARITQAKQVLALIKTKNPKRYPVVVAGDLNSNRSTLPSNGPYQAFVAGGLVDPLGSSAPQWFRPTTATAEHQIDVEYSSFNYLTRQARRTTYPVGTYVDYILVSNRVRVAEWRNVVTLDAAGQFVGVIPSDHNLISATIHLP